MSVDSLCFRTLNVLLIKSLSPRWVGGELAVGGPAVPQILYSCPHKHATLFILLPQSLGQETVPPASLPSTADKEVNFSIGFADLNGDLTRPCVCGNITLNWLLELCTMTVTIMLLLCKDRMRCRFHQFSTNGRHGRTRALRFNEL